ncbi:MAG: hypothetical protein R3352_05330 [Salinisphaeraceae bacterium]|nr:hypothetical protein [Salinisphaeraceae bacterium]
MCGGGAPDPVRRDPVKEQLEAERKATQAANAEEAVRKRGRRSSSLLATVGKKAGLLESGSVITRGKDTLGG